jgi:hypothetical protein
MREHTWTIKAAYCLRCGMSYEDYWNRLGTAFCRFKFIPRRRWGKA